MTLRALTAFLLLLPTSAFCSLKVIADFGGIAAAPFYESVDTQELTPELTISVPERTTGKAMLPVTSPRLSPGEVASRSIHLTSLTSPLFLVGDDKLSLNWITQHKATLKRIGAIGWAVNVDHQTALQRIRDAASGLPVLPIHGDDLAQRLALEHYPVLISSSVLQQ